METHITHITPDEVDRDLSLLEHIEHDPDITQASLAAQLGVAVGTVNWHIKRLVSKGYIKVKRAQRRKLRYIITPEGIALRTRLTVNYIETSLNLYRRTRQRVLELIPQIKQNDIDSVIIDGEGDIAEICRLTCMEQGLRVLPDPPRFDLAVSSNAAGTIVLAQPVELAILEVKGTKIFIRMINHEPGQSLTHENP